MAGPALAEAQQQLQLGGAFVIPTLVDVTCKTSRGQCSNVPGMSRRGQGGEDVLV